MMVAMAAMEPQEPQAVMVALEVTEQDMPLLIKPVPLHLSLQHLLFLLILLNMEELSQTQLFLLQILIMDALIPISL